MPTKNDMILTKFENGFYLSKDGGTSYVPINSLDCSAVSAIPACNTIIEKEKMPSKKSKTWLRLGGYNNNRLCVKIGDKDGFVSNTVDVMPEIKSVDIIESNGEKKVVVVQFMDNTAEKAVLDADDNFSLEHGVSICIAKKMFSMKVGKDNGSSVYNKVIERCLKIYHTQQKTKAKAEKEAAEKKAKYLKLIEKKKNKRIRRENEAREELINIHKEAYVRALREYHTVPKN